MDFNKCNINAINDRQRELHRWNKDGPKQEAKAAGKGNNRQPSKRKKRRK